MCQGHPDHRRRTGRNEPARPAKDPCHGTVAIRDQAGRCLTARTPTYPPPADPRADGKLRRVDQRRSRPMMTAFGASAFTRFLDRRVSDLSKGAASSFMQPEREPGALSENNRGSGYGQLKSSAAGQRTRFCAQRRYSRCDFVMPRASAMIRWRPRSAGTSFQGAFHAVIDFPAPTGHHVPKENYPMEKFPLTNISTRKVSVC